MRRDRIILGAGVVALIVVAAGAGLAMFALDTSAHAAPQARVPMQGVQASGIITLGGGTCLPDAVLTDCGGTVTEQLKGPGGAGFFVPYIGAWADLTGARRTCPGGGTYLDVVTIQPTVNPCHTPTPGGPTATPGGATATPGGPIATPTTAQPTATPPTAGNLALGKVVKASSSQPGQPPELAVDGDAASFWASNPGYDPYAPARNLQWIYVDLGDTYAVKTMHMTWGHWRHPRGYTIYAWLDYCGGWCRIASTSYGDGDDTPIFPEEVEARYWMLWLVNPYLIGGHYELLEWEIGGTSSAVVQGPNLAAGKPAVSWNHQPGFEAAKVSDADLATEWRSLNLPSWIYVDLMATEEFDRAILKWSPGLHATHYTLYAWNGWTWAPVYSKSTGAGGDETAIFPPVRTRYVLLYAAAGPAGNVGLREFEVYKRQGGGQPTPLLEGDWRSLRKAGAPDVVPEGTHLPERGSLDHAPPVLQIDRTRLPNPEGAATE